MVRGRKLLCTVEEFLDYYKYHSDASTAEHFSVSNKALIKFCDINNISRHTSDESRKLTKLEKYGDMNYNNRDKYRENYHSKSEEEKDLIKEKAKTTRINNAGSLESSFKSAVDKGKETRLSLYGDPNYNNREKAALTKQEKYGDAHFSNPDKAKQTKLRKYGDEHFVNPEKAKRTNISKYGVTCTLQNEEIARKTKKTNQEKYGNESYFASETFKEIAKLDVASRLEKTKSTVQKKYGCDCVFQSEEVKGRIKSTVQDRYGVDYFCLTQECRNGSKAIDSAPNLAFLSLMESAGIEGIEREFSIKNRAYDFKVGNYLIEVNPTPTHNCTYGAFGSAPLGTNYHKDKTLLANKNGYRCIHIWDWDNKAKIINLLSQKETVYGRNCFISEIPIKEARDFIERDHLQGYAKSSIAIGLFHMENLVAVMTFGKPRYNTKYQYELIRYCASANIIGGSQKLYKYFLDTYNPESVVSYCDLSKFSGDTYEKLGFSLVNPIEKVIPSKHWFNTRTQKHITDNLLRQRGFDQLFGKEYGYFGKGVSNEELMLQHGFVEIYDAGQATFVWKK